MKEIELVPKKRAFQSYLVPTSEKKITFCLMDTKDKGQARFEIADLAHLSGIKLATNFRTPQNWKGINHIDRSCH